MPIEAVARVLGQPRGAAHPIQSEIDLALAVEAGLKPASAEALADAIGLNTEEFERLIMPRRTLRYRREHKQTLTPDESDRAVRLARVWVLAVETFGDAEKARTWFRRPNRALKNHAPLPLLETGSGAIVVEQVLTRIAYGVFE
jgi:putative toxin-antitoxin system antitoxin component (TIGR02293 family)